jgi:site-specific DNA recombinase
MNVAAYIRVSSRAQNYATQRDAIDRAALARGDVIATIYEEKRSGRKLTERPELARLREDARAGHLRKLYVFRIDRLSRGGIKDTLEVIEELGRHGVAIVTLRDGFELEGPAAELVLAMIAWAAKMEHLAIGERIAAARDRVEARGDKWGRPVVHSHATVAEVVRRREAGHTIREISRAMKIPRSTVGTLSIKGERRGAPDVPADRGAQ